MPITAKELFAAGKVREAEKMLTAYLREHPSDLSQRTFLFELLCFSGDYARAEKQLAVLAAGSVESETGAIVYYAALHAEKTRHELFEKQAFPRVKCRLPAGKEFLDCREGFSREPDPSSLLPSYSQRKRHYWFRLPSFQSKLHLYFADWHCRWASLSWGVLTYPEKRSLQI